MSFNRRRFSSLLRKAKQARIPSEKGKALEDAVEYLINCVPGLKVYARDRRTKAEELDLIVFNEEEDPAFRDWDSIIYVECKNWSTPIGSSEITLFLDRMRTAGLSYGVLVARCGITGDEEARCDATLKVREALRERVRVIVLTLDDLEKIGSIGDFRQLVMQKYCKLFLFRIE